MRLARYEQNGRPGLAALDGDAWHGLLEGAAGYPGALEGLLAAGANLAEAGRALLKAPVVQLEGRPLKPPLMNPGKIICLGMNYKAHAAELGQHGQIERPELFARFSTTLVGHGEPIIRPQSSEQLDFEAELAVVIGRRGRHIKQREALDYVAGYSIFNDAAVRDFQFKGTQWTPGKNFDSTGPFGPFLVTPDELPPGAAGLNIESRLNGRVMQKNHTGDMIFPVAELIVIISEIMTLMPGDVLITGTPGGIGMSRIPPVFMQPGDICEIEIEGIGVLSNPVAQEK